MPRRLLVLDVVGLTADLLGPHTPNLTRLASSGSISYIEPVLPALTCSAQVTYLTGSMPREHGIVGNGWYFRDLAEVLFWRQSNHLAQGDWLWDAARRSIPDFTCANLFWWFNMYCRADTAVTVRPMYPADGRKIPDIYTSPADLRRHLNARLGTFPLFHFWGPLAGIRSSRWITDAALEVMQREDPTLTLVYLPHLDYPLQRLGPEHPSIPGELQRIDALCGELIDAAVARGAAVAVLSEYGVEPVDRPVHINRVLREAGLLGVREELGRELLDAGASQAFAVADHQIAHVYVPDPDRIPRVRALLERIEGVEQVLDEQGKATSGLDHPRSGELVAVAAPGCWFTYYYWMDDARAPDFARTVDIHRKPGYDPVELFIDPALSVPRLAVAWRLLKSRLGLRTLMDLIPLDARLVKGSHGRRPARAKSGALLLSTEETESLTPVLAPTQVKQALLSLMSDPDLRGVSEKGLPGRPQSV